jgi:hypothetical protein
LSHRRSDCPGGNASCSQECDEVGQIHQNCSSYTDVEEEGGPQIENTGQQESESRKGSAREGEEQLAAVVDVGANEALPGVRVGPVSLGEGVQDG